MKKLSLSSSIFHDGDVLSKDQLKNVLGGYGCAATFDTGQGQGYGNYLGYEGHYEVAYNNSDHASNNATYVVKNVSKEAAQEMVQNGGHWCCDSCDSASWY
jgi:hypothetical protein